MKLQTLYILLIFIFAVSIHSKNNNISEGEEEQIEDEYKLKILNESNYDSFLSNSESKISNSHLLILLHNPWCKFSQNLEKKLMNVNKLLKMENQKYFIGAIDTTLVDAKKIISEKIPLDIINPLISYPKLIYFKDGKPVELYKGKHNKNDIYTYIKRKIYIESASLPIYSIFESKIVNDKNAFVYFGAKDAKFEIFNTFAKETKDFMFYETNDDEIYKKLNPSRNSTVIYYTFGKVKDSLILKNQNFTSQIFKRFIKKNTFVNLYDKVSEEFINEVIMKKQTAMILFRSEYDNTTLFLEENFPLLSKGEPSMKFLITDLTGKFELKLAQLLNVAIDSLPALRIIDFKEGGLRRFEMSRDPNMENVMNFINLYKDNKLHPYSVSQALSTDTKKKDSLKIITTSNYFESVVFNKKNFVVFFHAGWCTHCKKVH